MARPLTRLQAARVPLEGVQPCSQLIFSRELVDLIVDELEEDTPALANLGLVSRAWYPRTRCHLFYSIIIGPNKPAYELKVLLNLLHKQPFLGQCIRQLELANQPSTIWLGASDSRTSRRLSTFLSLLPSLTHLSVNGLSKLHMPDASPSFQKSIYVTALKKPTLRHVLLEGITGISVGFIAGLRELEGLSLSNVDTDEVPDFTLLDKPLASLHATALTNGPRFDYLDVTHSGRALLTLFVRATSGNTTDLARILYPRNVDVGTGGWTDEMERAWDIFLKTGAHNVETLTVVHNGPLRFSMQPMSNEHFPPSIFKLDQFTELTELTVMIVHGVAPDPPDNPIPHLLAGLYNLSQSSNGPKNLRKIHLAFYLPKAGNDGDIGEPLRSLSREPFWSELSGILASKGRVFGQLEQVVVMFNSQESSLSQKAWEDTRDGLCAAMRELDEKDILVVEKAS